MNQLLRWLIILSPLAFVYMQSTDDFQEIELKTADDVNLSASYAVPAAEFPRPVVIMIHQGGSSRQEWLEITLPAKLIESGYAVLAYDVRNHGKSGKDEGDLNDLFNNPKRAPLDLQAVLSYLANDTRIDKSRIGIVGASIGANLACVAASSDEYRVKSIVSISAKVSAVQNLSGVKDSLTFKNAFYMASANEQEGKRERWANELFERTSGYRQVEIATGNKHGSFILREQPYLENQILEWLAKTL